MTASSGSPPMVALGSGASVRGWSGRAPNARWCSSSGRTHQWMRAWQLPAVSWTTRKPSPNAPSRSGHLAGGGQQRRPRPGGVGQPVRLDLPAAQVVDVQEVGQENVHCDRP
jgi:hypothetical protein